MGEERIVATDRDEDEMCEASTPGCCIDHSAESDNYGTAARDLGCATW